MKRTINKPSRHFVAFPPPSPKNRSRDSDRVRITNQLDTNHRGTIGGCRCAANFTITNDAALS